MKKLLLFIAVVMVSLSASAQKLDKVIEKYQASPTAQCITLTKDMIGMMTTMAEASGKMSDDDRQTMEMLKDIDSMTTLVEENVDTGKGEEFLSDLRKALKKEWTISADAEEEDGKAVIATKKNKAKDDYVSEVVIGAVADNQMVLVYVTGKIKEDQVGNLMKLNK